MTEYVCKYVPAELLAGFEEESLLYNFSAKNFDAADKIIHRNICSFSKALLEHRMEKCSGPIILTNCCDSIKRSGDILCGQAQKVFMLDLPHKDGPCARQLYKKELIRFIREFSEYSQKDFDCEKFKAACGKQPEEAKIPYILLMGARMSEELLAYIKSASLLPIVNRTCTGNRKIGPAPLVGDTDKLMDWYAKELLFQPPCMRMTDTAARKELINDPNICRIIYNTVSFCDYYLFEYSRIAKELPAPILKIETDYTVQSVAQLKNRLDAFFENLPTHKTNAGLPCTQVIRNDDKCYFAGIDSGSTSTNAVILDGEKRIVSFAALPTGISVAESAAKAFDIALKRAGISKEQINRTVSTGYGRAGIGFSDWDVTEITCHAKGAFFLNPGVRTVIDIGGQDSKIIRLDANGNVKAFAMNDKCAAGTGRFLEMMAQSLGITLEEISVCGLKWNEEIVISSMCSVFAQSEVVSLIAAGKKLPDIVHGLNVSVASRVITLGGRVGIEKEYMMTGGVAKNTGVVRAIKEKLGYSVLLPEEPEICGALGAALIAREENNT